MCGRGDAALVRGPLPHSPRRVSLCYCGVMVNHTRVVVYVPAKVAKSLRAEGKDPQAWVRALVKRAFEKRGNGA